jgi:glycosyltransferase involved in cell wall biosynthesis
VIWNSLGRGSVGYTVNSLLENMPAGRVDKTLWALSRDPDLPREFHRPALPSLVHRAMCKIRAPHGASAAIAREVMLPKVREGDIVWVWPPYDLKAIKRAKDRGAIVVGERINCMSDMVRDLLTKAYARRGLPLPPEWNMPGAIEREREQMLECDYVTAPSSFVAESVRNAGVPESRILRNSYGYDPHRLAAGINAVRPVRPPVFAFVGLGIVRKGLDVVLEAWEKADAPGKLLIAGTISGDIKQDYADILARPDVELLGHVADVATVYGAADVFLFPTHEEGSPQVTYEAAACGLASIVSAMGATGVIRDRIEGLIVDPLSVDSVAAAITELSMDQKLRSSLGSNAATRAQEFTWPNVASRLYRLFRSITGKDSLRSDGRIA